MSDRQSWKRIATLWGGLMAFATALFSAVVALRPEVPGTEASAEALDRILLWYSLLPRGVCAILSGASLGLAGALLQRILRNPLADASTLGIASGAQLGLTAAAVFVTGAVAVSREAVAFAGALGAVSIVLALTWRRGFDPLAVVLSGMVISLVAAALSATMILARGDYVLSIYIWGAGSLNQQNWDTAIALAPRLAAGLAAAILLLRPLTVAGMGDGTARSLGARINAIRLGVIVLAVWISATVTSEVGVIGFVGLAGPTLARLTGARTIAQVVLGSVLGGAVILSVTDSAVQLLGSGFTDLAPTGAATALLGGPLLLWLLARARGRRPAPAAVEHDRGAPLERPRRAFLLLGGLAILCAGAALFVGQTIDGWSLASGTRLADLLPFRLPRIVAAGAAGAMLGAAGTVLQRLTGNALSSPEVLGVSTGAGVGLAVALMVAPPHPLFLLSGLIGGAFATLVVILTIAARSGFGPERLLLGGIGISAFCMAVISTVLSQGDMRSYVLLVWMSGSTNNVGEWEVWAGAGSTLLLVPPLFLLSRWLDILPLGETESRSLGLKLGASRLALCVVSALLTAIASFLVGPMSLVGLIAPHLARLLGFARAREQLAAAVLIGFSVTVVADWVARVVVFPYQVPVGLFAALIGGPYLIWLLTRGGRQHA